MPIRRKYDALNRLEKAQRQFNNALEIGSCPTELHERRRRVNSAVIGTSITGLVGGVLGIVGLILIPFTLGASLGLTITGGVIGGASSIVQGGFRVHEAVQQNCSLSEIKEGLEKVQEELQQALTDFASQFDSHAFGDRGPESPGWSIKGTMTFGSVFRVAHSIAGIILAAVKVGATLATVIASIFGPISVLLDGSFLVEAIYDKITGDHTQAGKKLECLRAFQTVLQTTFRGNEDFSICIVENTMQTK
ncbi:hypothetical protein DPMN_093299 [Dreissena polymorpha]|uniref:Uncharacterized protein n=2 Tax=Dreissena polymorpha TaxID=45954 RepID=A0A9D4L3L6_DREPO|nr:hypothetical protein DPMN_093299 [Dreissena polymorpha]